MAKPVQLNDVKAVKFVNYMPSADGELILIQVQDPRGTTGWVALPWSHVSEALQTINRAAEKCGARRKELGKSELWDGKQKVSAQLVKTFQVSEIPDQHLKVLSLASPTGFRCDFAIPTNAQDVLGRPMHRGIAEELLRDQAAERARPM